MFPAQAQAASLRALLADPQPPHVLHAAILNLRPRPAQRRLRPSDTAEQQRAFCALALSLLAHSGADAPAVSPEPRYALVQHLPSGDYWSSLSSDRPSSPSVPLSHLDAGFAELTVVLPTPLSTSSTTLASYSPKNLPPPKPLPQQRSLVAASFLDYGPYANFAPAFDHDGELVGRRDLGLVLSYKQQRKALKYADTIHPSDDHDHDDLPLLLPHVPFDVQAEFDGLLSPQVVQNLKAALDTAHLENLIDELLTRTQRALVRLQALQIDRLLQYSSPNSLDESSEEWQTGIPSLSLSLYSFGSHFPLSPPTANGILESLQTLASLRPRASSHPDFLSIIPSPSVLHNLYKTLALQPCPGWHGTLPENRITALRDDSTVKVHVPSAVPAQPQAAPSTSSSPAPTSTTPLAAAAPPTTVPYAGYPYIYNPQQAQAYRSATGTVPAATSYAPYKTGATSYYQNYIQNAQPQYYGQQAYGTGVTSQQPYAAYNSWFAHAHQYAGTAAAASGHATPQPASTATAAAAAAPYGYYVPSQQQQQKPVAQGTATTSAVANTATTNKTMNNGSASGTSAWGGYVMGQQPTLPARMASATPTTTNGVHQQFTASK